MSERIFLTYEEAIYILPLGETIHTMINEHMCLIGADWSRKDIYEKLKNSEVYELAGEQAKATGHGLVVYNKDTKYQSELLFIETDKRKLQEMERLKSRPNELRPCPFCGGKAHIMDGGYPHWIYCEECGAKVHGGVVGEEEGVKASIEAWNRRTESE